MTALWELLSWLVADVLHASWEWLRERRRLR
jgi:hypothetical protein